MFEKYKTGRKVSNETSKLQEWERKLDTFHVSETFYFFLKKTNFMTPFYGWGSTAARLEPLGGGSLLFTTKFPEIQVIFNMLKW